MKSAHQIAIETGLEWQQIYSIITKEGIIPAEKKGYYNYYDKYQEDYIHSILFFSCMITELTIESKMNIQETKEEQYEKFREFKRNTYGIK